MSNIIAAYSYDRKNKQYVARSYVCNLSDGLHHSYKIGFGDSSERAIAECFNYTIQSYRNDGLELPDFKLVNKGKIKREFLDLYLF